MGDRNGPEHADRSEIQYCRYVGRDIVKVSGRLAEQFLLPEQPKHEFEIEEEDYFALQLALMEAITPYSDSVAVECLEKIQTPHRKEEFLVVMQGSSTFYFCENGQIEALEQAIAEKVQPFL